MARIDMLTCMPFRAWNRLEPRTRDNEFDKELECGVHDALWMLTRQWQMGELQGEDTGSAIFAKVRMNTTPVTRYKTAKGPVLSFDDLNPFEQKVEAINTEKDFHTKIESGYMLLSALNKAAEELSAPFNRNSYRSELIKLFKLDPLPVLATTDSRDMIIAKANILASDQLTTLMSAGSENYFDGEKAYTSAKNGTLLVSLQLSFPADVTFISNAISDFTGWYEMVHAAPAVDETSWIPEQLEYSFACSLPEKDAKNTVLNAKEYYSGDLEWYSFDVSKDPDLIDDFEAPSVTEESKIKSELFSMIPVEARFAGAPHARWWQFENGNIDLGNIRAEKTDLSKMITTEYALMYGNDWLLIPYVVPVGTLCEIKGIAVTDVFGEVNFIEAANQGETDNWAAWGMFNLSVSDPSGARNLQADTRTYIPPATVKTLNGEPLEEVRFVRDEMSNHVWAVENKIPDHTGFALEGHNFAIRFRELLDEYDTRPPLLPPDENVMFKYVLGNTVPENWIPFLPVHEAGGNRAIRLKRASMPRLLKDEYSRVRPRSPLVREGIDGADNQVKAYYINEEEVPRSCVTVKGNFQRTRWYNGVIASWYGYRKHTGKGEGSSGLAYDKVEPVVRSEATKTNEEG